MVSELYSANAGYRASWNKIVIQAGILRAPFFSTTNFDSMNYGAIGSIIGHEIIHAYTEFGSELDKNGYLRDWWQPEDKKKLMKKLQCSVDQYEEYICNTAGKVEDGKFVREENVADNDGIKVSYRQLKWTLKRQKSTYADIATTNMDVETTNMDVETTYMDVETTNMDVETT
ncbi:endothelin-converting enzyme 1 [Plakobranchus ocellatus]|uniref:Endothelin-converting enzyme 1 n=1 Tax=Plakobranchus ocellatus TaxID=259542 RepID=A0AAV4BN85_9GAST|nr:endothelin-converting enzyme 1 [Plakobranchus ocellatus]